MVQKTTKSHPDGFPGLFTRFVSSNRASIALLISMLVLVLFYRIQLTYRLFTSPVRPFDFSPKLHPLLFAVKYLPGDLAAILLFFFASSLLSCVEYFANEGSVRRLFRVSGYVFLHIFLMALLLAHGLHGRLLFDGQTGLESAVILEGVANLSLLVILRLMEFKDFFFILLPIGLFWLVFLSPPRLRVWMGGIALVMIALLTLGSVLGGTEHRGKGDRPPAEIRLNPALFLLSDVADRVLQKHPSGGRGILTADEKEEGIHLSGATYAHAAKPLKFLPGRRTEPWNLVFFVMESVGARYIFDTDYGNPMPMPFLYRLSKEGWFLRNHFTTSNLSTKAFFSLMSGLYDFFHQENFGLRPDAVVPSLYNFMPPDYDAFLVTPAPLTWFFPSAFIRNTGLPEIHSYENLNLKVREELHQSLGRYVARDEVETVDFFLERLSDAREPFMGIYVSFVAHFPYFDYGPDYEVRENDGRLITRYYNNLNLLDQMIKRIYDHLEKEGKLERTILVIVGDHGQAFGQHHPDNYMHFRYSYNENLECPAILYQPGLFKPRFFDFPTSHVDLLPTLLDAMGIPYSPALFDGESLYQHKLRRKYLFFYGHEGSISSLDNDQVKVQYSLKKDRFWAFDLKVDPEERTPLNGSAYRPQLEALQKFARHHDSSLVDYNAAVRGNKDFQGYRHPTLR